MDNMPAHTTTRPILLRRWLTTDRNGSFASSVLMYIRLALGFCALGRTTFRCEELSSVDVAYIAQLAKIIAQYTMYTSQSASRTDLCFVAFCRRVCWGVCLFCG